MNRFTRTTALGLVFIGFTLAASPAQACSKEMGGSASTSSGGETVAANSSSRGFGPSVGRQVLNQGQTGFTNDVFRLSGERQTNENERQPAGQRGRSQVQ